jgi:uncharacterized protein
VRTAAARTASAHPTPSLTHRNNWLGRSQYTGDPPFQGRILDFRIYSSALTPTLLQASLNAGPDADW